MASVVTIKLSLPDANLNIETLRYAEEKLRADQKALPYGAAKGQVAKRLLRVQNLIRVIESN